MGARTFGARFRELRTKADKRLIDVAKAWDTVPSFVSEVETARRKAPPLDLVRKALALFGPEFGQYLGELAELASKQRDGDIRVGRGNGGMNGVIHSLCRQNPTDAEIKKLLEYINSGTWREKPK
jgi:transcriptional regulator with XRE-family HTH domain